MLTFGPRRSTGASPPEWEWRIRDDQDESLTARIVVGTVGPGGGKSKGVYLQAEVEGLQGFELPEGICRSSSHGARAAEDLGLQIIAGIKLWDRSRGAER